MPMEFRNEFPAAAEGRRMVAVVLDGDDCWMVGDGSWMVSPVLDGDDGWNFGTRAEVAKIGSMGVVAIAKD